MPGRPAKQPRDPATVRAMIALRTDNVPLARIGQEFGISRQAVFMLCKRWEQWALTLPPEEEITE